MPKCPKCGKEITSLRCIIHLVAEYELTAKSEDDFDYKEVWEEEDELYLRDYYCPKCGKTLFNIEDDAINFLLGKEVETAEE